MDAPISARNDNTTGSIVDVRANLLFEVTDVATSMDLEWKTAGSQQLPNARFAFPGAPPTGGGIQEQVNSLG